MIPTKEMVDRFLSWPLPLTVNVDAIACTPGAAYRSGSNLLSADEAAQMLRHVLQLGEGSDAAALQALLAELGAERARQDAKWGGPVHDDQHTTAEFAQLIQDYAAWARVMSGMGSHVKARSRLMQVAALAIAAVQSLDRNVARGYQYHQGVKVYMSREAAAMD